MDCSKCVFVEGVASSGGYVQVGCSADRLSTLVNRGKARFNDDDGSYHLQQFCNMYRTEKWSSSQEEDGDRLAIARSEITPSFGVVIQDDTESDIEQLEQTLASFCSMDYDSDKMKIVISSTTHREPSDIVRLVHDAQKHVEQTEYVSHLHSFKAIQEKESFQKIVDRNYFVYAKVGATARKSLFKDVDSSLNTTLEQITMYKSGDISCCPSNVVRSLYLDHNDYDLMLLDLEKISKEQGMYRDI